MSHPPPGGRAIHDPGAAPTEQQATKKRGRRGGRRRGRRAKVLRQIEAHVRERREVWGPTRTLDDALYVAGVHDRKLGHDYEDLRKADRDDYTAGTPEGEPYRGRTQRLA